LENCWRIVGELLENCWRIDLENKKKKIDKEHSSDSWRVLKINKFARLGCPRPKTSS